MLHSTTKTCRTCGKKKFVSEFYQHTNGKPHSDCLVCYQTRRSSYRPKPRDQASHSHEQLAIDRAKLFGIYAAPGKCSEWRWVDVIAWGCVKIEVKYSAASQHFQFNIGEKFTKSDIAVLIFDYGHKKTYHVFLTTNEIFYTKNGIKKSFACYPDYTGRYHNPHIVPELINAEDNWNLVNVAVRVKGYNLTANGTGWD
jgi:hypothetical protein